MHDRIGQSLVGESSSGGKQNKGTGGAYLSTGRGRYCSKQVLL